MLSINSEEGSFWQFEEHDIQILPEDQGFDLFYLIISFDGYVSYKEYEVNYYSFWEFIGQLGGFYEILELFGMFFIGF